MMTDHGHRGRPTTGAKVDTVSAAFAYSNAKRWHGRFVLTAAILGLAFHAPPTLDARRGGDADARQFRGVVPVSAGVTIYPGEDIERRMSGSPPGTTFVLKPGMHRMQTIRPRDRDTFSGEPGAILSGARLLVNFTVAGDHWVASGQMPGGVAHGDCEVGYPRCRFPEQLFIDDVLLRHVETPEEVGPGTWHFNYGTGQIHFADDPTGRRVEISAATTAVEATGNQVTVSGLIVEKYANLAQNGAISAEGKTGWIISRNEVRWNHGVGIRIGPGARVSDNNVHHNGQLGIGGVGADVVVDGNEIAYNNTARFDPSWEAGGAKFVDTTNLVVRNNFVHHNGGPGLWTDSDNLNTLYEHNTSEDNERMGIMHEISYSAVIRHNIVRRNGFGFPAWIWGAGILIAASRDVEVHGNTVEDNADGIGAVQQSRGSGKYGPYQISNLWVHDNTVTMAEGWTGLVEDVGDPSYFTSRNNRFERNRYNLGSAGVYFTWMNADRSETQWKSYRQDVSGTFAR
ncbi:MAG: right-handed parallel beta-helix repeat-containing protein [Luteitalea sp.]|nr:right-handed parallel beta-helix repeat-containing protein [Luteitalea sp.]